ncbi:hypothetical protein GJ496_007329 [Pomphorhynchus laevis]|nr:hypothetical protein GJ496_007329 [Pomphorhynchus laevis]
MLIIYIEQYEVDREVKSYPRCQQIDPASTDIFKARVGSVYGTVPYIRNRSVYTEPTSKSGFRILAPLDVDKLVIAFYSNLGFSTGSP